MRPDYIGKIAVLNDFSVLKFPDVWDRQKLGVVMLDKRNPKERDGMLICYAIGIKGYQFPIFVDEIIHMESSKLIWQPHETRVK